MRSPTITACPLPALTDLALAEPFTMLLDAAPRHPLGQRSLLARAPFQVAVVRGRRVAVYAAGGCREEWGDPWAIMRELMAPYRQAADPRHPCPGGVVGYLSYDLARLRFALPDQPDPLGLPDAVFGFYRDVICWLPGDAMAWHGRAAAAPDSVARMALDLPAPGPHREL
ncbi:MAG TPA: hypothetical protein VD886_09170, partial [Herpetosiphonaceae bacterium]|nr:hypothetical protein [Herpetosiphonaceae bacterium]